MAAARNYLILICSECESSIRVRRGELPEKCPVCWSPREQHGFRVMLDGEITNDDRKRLAGFRIKLD